MPSSPEPSPRVGVLAPPNDPDADVYAAALERAGAEVVRLWFRAVPERLALTVDLDDVRLGDRSLGGLRGLLVRKLYFSFPPAHLADVEERNGRTLRARFVAARERASLVRTALLELERRGTTVVNPPDRVLRHTEKLDQAMQLHRAGLPVPPSLGTSDPGAVRAFFAAHQDAGVIYKPLSGGGQAALLTPADLDEVRLAQLQNAPVLFQRRIPGPEWRVYVVNGHVVAAAELDTTDVIDARDNLASATPVAVDETTGQLCTKAVAHLGLLYAACDVRQSPDGPVLLEVNPAPAIRFYPAPVQDAVTAALTRLLLGGAA